MCGVETASIANSVSKYIASVFAITGSAKVAKRTDMVTANALCEVGGIADGVGWAEVEKVDGRGRTCDRWRKHCVRTQRTSCRLLQKRSSIWNDFPARN